MAMNANTWHAARSMSTPMAVQQQQHHQQQQQHLQQQQQQQQHSQQQHLQQQQQHLQHHPYVAHAHANAHSHAPWSGAPSNVDDGIKHHYLASPSTPAPDAVVTGPDMSSYPAHIRHTSVVSGGDVATQHRLATAPSRPMPSGPWRLHHDDHSNAPPSLQVHIPQSSNQDLSRRPSTSTTAHAPDGNHPFVHHDNNNAAAQYAASGGSTSLPSFASLQERTARNEDGDLIIAPMSQRLTCNMCTKLKPLVREIAAAVGDVDESVQSLSTKSINRTSEFPNDNAVRTAQWILERLGYAKAELQDVGRRTQLGYFSTQPGGTPSFGSRNLSPPNHLKRNADQWERDDLPKRPRSGASSDQPYQMSSGITPRDDRRPSMDYASRDMYQRTAYSPPPESFPGSAHPNQGSPMTLSRAPRALPSPSSMAYPPSAAPSLPPPTAQSVGSPATSYQPSSSIHTATTNSATTAHMADLQHQVTLKSLALQTLQDEYASLLQKLQRERVKSQTIEKKTSVADQEVNELTGKNEELTDQVRMLERQLEESEKKRELDRAEAAKEKDQWGRMLEMGGRLQAKINEERQKLIDEKGSLLERIAALEQQDPAQRKLALDKSGSQPHHAPRPVAPSSTALVPASQAIDGDQDHVNLKGEIIVLNGRVDALRSALEDARRHNRDLEDKAGAFAQHTSQVHASIERALRDEESKAKVRLIDYGVAGSPETRAASSYQKPSWSPKPAAMLPPRPSRGSTTPSIHPAIPLERSSTSITAAGTATLAQTSADVGFDTASSSEDVIRSLAPFPAPPKMHPDPSPCRASNATSPLMRYQSVPPYNASEHGAWTPPAPGSFWNPVDRLTPLKHTSSHPIQISRIPQHYDSPYRSGTSPQSSSSPQSDMTDEASSSSSIPQQTSFESYASDSDLPRHVDVKPLIMTTSSRKSPSNAHSTPFVGYPRDATYMLPPPRPA